VQIVYWCDVYEKCGGGIAKSLEHLCNLKHLELCFTEDDDDETPGCNAYAKAYRKICFTALLDMPRLVELHLGSKGMGLESRDQSWAFAMRPVFERLLKTFTLF